MRRILVAILSSALFTIAVPAAFADGAADYKAKCQMCHAADGSGKTPAGEKMGAHDLRSPDVVKMTDAQMIEITAKGKNKMPGFAGKLTNAQIKDLITYIRELQKKK